MRLYTSKGKEAHAKKIAALKKTNVIPKKKTDVKAKD